jgi:regulator of sigma E protease
MIFSPSTGAYKQVGGFKAIRYFFRALSWEVFENHGFTIDYAKI